MGVCCWLPNADNGNLAVNGFDTLADELVNVNGWAVAAPAVEPLLLVVVVLIIEEEGVVEVVSGILTFRKWNGFLLTVLLSSVDVVAVLAIEFGRLTCKMRRVAIVSALAKQGYVVKF